MRKNRHFLTGILLLVTMGLHAQTTLVTGTVKDLTGTPIPSATIRIKNAKGGTSSDMNGVFSIKASVNTELLISGIGYETKEVKVTGATMSVVLNTDSKSLSEVVVTGVGVATSKKHLGIDVESVNSDQLPPSPTASIDQALIGKIPGAQISSIDGTPGASVNILLRGINTLQSGTMPMILLDGLEVKATNLNTLDLSTIDRVEVVEGAASAALYGAQGANGVIQLFTKKGKPGKTNIDISSSVARNSYLNVGNLHKANFHSLVTDANNNVIDAGGNIITYSDTTGLFSANTQWPSTSPTNINNKLYNRNLSHYDHYKEFFIPANTWNNTLTVSGAKEHMDFMISASNNYQNSNFLNNGYYSRSNLTSNLGIELMKGLRLRSLTQIAYTKNTILSDQGYLYALNNTQPFAPYQQKLVDGTYAAYTGSAAGVNGYNPNFMSEYTHYGDNKIDVVENLDLDFKLPKFVELDAKYGLNYQNEYARTIYPNQTTNVNAVATDYYSGYDLTGSIANYQYHRTFQNFLGTAIVRLDFDRDFKLKIPLVSTTEGGFDWRHDVADLYQEYGIGLPVATPYTVAAPSSYTPSSYPYTGITPFVTYGYLVNEKLEWSDFIGIAGGFRTDYSSAFGGGHSPFTFPNANAFLRISAMDFWKTAAISDWFNELKFRGAFGKAGIQPGPFDRFPVLSTAPLGSTNPYYFSSSQPNPNLNVEVSQEKEVGTDMTFGFAGNTWFKQIALSFTWWDRKTNNAIWSTDVAPSTGVGTYKNNAFSLGSNGVQLGLNVTVLAEKSFTWNFTTNIGHQTSKILSTDGQPIVITSNAGSTNYVLQAGEKVGQLYGYMVLHSVGQVDPNTGQPFIDKADQGTYSVASNGVVVNTATKSPYVTGNLYSFGDPNPKFNASFINDLSYKGIVTLSFQFDWIYGSHLYNQTKEWMYRDGIHGDYDKKVSIGGDNEAWTAFYRGMYANVSRDGTKNYFYEGASFLRLRNVAAGVDLAKAFKLHTVRKIQLVLSGRNLWTKTKYTGFDPEISSGSTNSAWDRGTDHNTMPNYKSWQAGLNIGL